MTKNQLEFWNLQETKANNLRTWNEVVQHNRNIERETNRSNVEREYLTRQQNAETNRANLERERQNRDTLNEQRRHSLNVESETNRSNLANEAIARANSTNNLLKIMGDQRIASTANSIAQQNASTNRLNALTSSLSQQETARSHKAQEKLQYSSQAETHRANQTQESLSSERNLLQSVANYNAYKNMEIQRDYNMANIALQQAKINQQERFNEANLIMQAFGTTARTATDVLKMSLLKKGVTR